MIEPTADGIALATSWALLSGFAGYFSLGHAAFAGAGMHVTHCPVCVMGEGVHRPDRHERSLERRDAVVHRGHHHEIDHVQVRYKNHCRYWIALCINNLQVYKLDLSFAISIALDSMKSIVNHSIH